MTTERVAYKMERGRKLSLLAAGWMAIAAPIAFAQAGARPDAASALTASEVYVPTLTFDVASIRQSPAANFYRAGGSFSPHSSFLRLTNCDVMYLVALAYGVQAYQMSGLPDWRAMFNIEAKSDTLWREGRRVNRTRHF